MQGSDAMPANPTSRYKGRAAIVTGGGSGIGAAITRALLAEGAGVVVGDLNIERVGELTEKYGDAVLGVTTNVTDPEQVERLTGTAVERFGRLDAAFNVAGFGGHAEIVDITREDWQRVVDVCLTGLLFSVQSEARRMTRGGAIVNVASINGETPMRGGVAYCASKAGAVMLTKVAALELGDRGIRVNAVSPGLTDTPLTAAVLAHPAARQAYLDRIPLGEVGTPEQMASAALFLGSDEASYVSGVDLAVDGAWRTTGYPDLRAAFGD